MEQGRLTIETYPSGSKIYIDGSLVLDDNGEPGLTPAILTVDVGSHNIKLTLEGYCDEYDSQYVEKNENVVIVHNFYVC